MSRSYQNFDLIIERAGSVTCNNYRVRVDAPTGKCTVDFAIPFSLGDLDKFVCNIGWLDIKIVKRFGARLFKALFTDEVLSVFSTSLYEAKNKEESHGLRIRLLLTGAPELADIPWEYLYNPTSNRFLSLSTDTPIIRYLDLPQINPPFKVDLPLRVLVMTSNPYDYPSLNVEQEWKNLQESLSPLQEKGMVEVVRMKHATIDGLLQYLRQNEYHVFHFIGHGTFDTHSEGGYLIFENERKEATPVSGERLGVILHDEKLRMAVLNACRAGRGSQTNSFAGVGQSLIQQGVSAVIAMQFSISDRAALIFSRKFYQALTDGYLVDAALAEARKAIFAQEKKVEWGTPVLYSSVSKQRIFDIDSPSPNILLPYTEGLPLQDTIIAYLNEAKKRIKDYKEEENKKGEVAPVSEGWPITFDIESNESELPIPVRETEQQNLERAFFNRGKKQFNEGNWTEAVAILRYVPEHDKNYPEAKQLITTIEAQRPRKRKKPSNQSIIEHQHIFVLVAALLFILLAAGLMKRPELTEYIGLGDVINSFLDFFSPPSTEARPLLVATETLVTEVSHIEPSFVSTETPLPSLPRTTDPPRPTRTFLVTIVSATMTPISVGTNKPILFSTKMPAINTPIPTESATNDSTFTEDNNSVTTEDNNSIIATTQPLVTEVSIIEPTSDTPFVKTLTPTTIPTATVVYIDTSTPTTTPTSTPTTMPTSISTAISPTDTATPTNIAVGDTATPTAITQTYTATPVITTSSTSIPPTEIPIIIDENIKTPLNTDPNMDETNGTDDYLGSIGNKASTSTPESTE